MIGMPHGRAQRQTVTIGGSRDGRVLAYRLDILAGRGRLPPARRVPALLHPLMAPGGVRHPAGRVARPRRRDHHDLDRGLPRRGPARGDRGDRAGDGPVRRRDRHGPGRGPQAQPHPARRVPVHDQGRGDYDSGEYAGGAGPGARRRGLRGAARRAGRAPRARRRRPARHRRSPRYVEITGGGAFAEDATVEVHPDGTATVLTGTSPHGQGHATAWAMLASEQLGIPMEKITVRHGDTDLVPRGAGTDGLAQPAARRRRGAPGRGRAGRAGPAARRGRAGGRGRRPRGGRGRGAGARHGRRGHAGPARRDRAAADGGHVRLRRPHVPVRRAPGRRRGRHRDRQGGRRPDRHRRRRRARCSTRCSPRASGTAGSPRASPRRCSRRSFRRRRQPADRQLRRLRASRRRPSCPASSSLDMATPTHLNPLGVKGIGEAGTIGATPAVQNAVVDAVAHLGVRHIDMPATPLRVWEAIQAARRAGRAREGRHHRQRRAVGRGRRAAPAARALPARHPRPDGDQHRLRHHLVRRLHGAPRRRVGEVLHGARRAGRRRRGHDDGGALAVAGRAAPGGRRVPAGARAPVRLLHAGHGDGRGRAARRAPAADRARGARGPGGQPLPVHRLPQHRAGGAARAGQDPDAADEAAPDLVAPGFSTGSGA